MLNKKESTSYIFIALLAISTIMVGILPFLPLPQESETGLGIFFGRFHPLILHFPIVLILLLLGLEVWTFWNRKKHSKPAPIISNSLFTVLLGLAVISSFVTAIAGYLLFQSGEYQGTLTKSHLWGGVLLTISLNLATFFYWQYQGKKLAISYRLFQTFLLITGALTLYTSHLGGSITHGTDFLTEHMPSLSALEASDIENKKPQELLVYQDLIRPAFESRCLSCHNEHKTKGGLLMTSLANLTKGGKSEKPMLVASQPDASELFHRISLPATHDDHMPPSEKPPLTKEEITLIHWWISEGADPDMLVGLEPPDSIALLLDGYLPKLFRKERLKIRQKKEQEALAKELSQLGDKLGLVIQADSTTEEIFFAISMQMPPVFVDNKTINKLMPYASLFSKVSLPGAEINDEVLFEFGRMPNLRELYLPKTCIKGTGLIYLKSLSKLETINLSHSFLSNTGILNISHLPSLKEIYVFNTEVDTLMTRAMDKHLSKVKLLVEEGPYF